MWHYLPQYLLESSFCLLAFYLFYRLVLQGETFFQTNRVYLILTPILSILIPLLNIGLEEQAIVESPFLYQEVFYTTVENMATIEAGFTAQMVQDTPVFTLQWYQVLLVIYLLGCLLMSGRLFRGLRYLFRLSKKTKLKQETGHTIVQVDEKMPLASFFSFVFWNEDKITEEQKLILEHELVHVRQWHSLDVLYMELIAILKWFNPLIYWYKRSLKTTHEYIADAYASQLAESPYQYAQLMITGATQPTTGRLVNHFYSLTKQRLIMLAKAKSSNWKQAKLLLVLPLVAVLMSLFSFNLIENMAIYKETTEELNQDFGDFSERDAVAIYENKEILEIGKYTLPVLKDKARINDLDDITTIPFNETNALFKEQLDLNFIDNYQDIEKVTLYKFYENGLEGSQTMQLNDSYTMKYLMSNVIKENQSIIIEFKTKSGDFYTVFNLGTRKEFLGEIKKKKLQFIYKWRLGGMGVGNYFDRSNNDYKKDIIAAIQKDLKGNWKGEWHTVSSAKVDLIDVNGNKATYDWKEGQNETLIKHLKGEEVSIIRFKDLENKEHRFRDFDIRIEDADYPQMPKVAHFEWGNLKLDTKNEVELESLWTESKKPLFAHLRNGTVLEVKKGILTSKKLNQGIDFQNYYCRDGLERKDDTKHWDAPKSSLKDIKLHRLFSEYGVHQFPDISIKIKETIEYPREGGNSFGKEPSFEVADKEDGRLPVYKIHFGDLSYRLFFNGITKKGNGRVLRVQSTLKNKILNTPLYISKDGQRMNLEGTYTVKVINKTGGYFDTCENGDGAIRENLSCTNSLKWLTAGKKLELENIKLSSGELFQFIIGIGSDVDKPNYEISWGSKSKECSRNTSFNPIENGCICGNKVVSSEQLQTILGTDLVFKRNGIELPIEKYVLLHIGENRGYTDLVQFNSYDGLRAYISDKFKNGDRLSLKLLVEDEENVHYTLYVDDAMKSQNVRKVLWGNKAFELSLTAPISFLKINRKEFLEIIQGELVLLENGQKIEVKAINNMTPPFNKYMDDKLSEKLYLEDFRKQIEENPQLTVLIEPFGVLSFIIED